MLIEKNLINEKYLYELKKKCRESLQREYNLDQFDFNDFKIINAFLINKVIFNNDFNLLINILDKKERRKLYVPAILITAIFSFYKNYIHNLDFPYLPAVGEIVQQRGRRLKVIEITDEKRYRLQSIDKQKTFQETDEEGIKTFFVTTGDLSERIVRQKFDHYKELFDSIFSGIGDKLPSKFEHKSVIVAKTEIIEKLKEFKIGSKKIYSSIPFQYISKNNTRHENLPIDPMIYIVNEYETIREFVFNEDNVKVDTIIFIGETKYKDWLISISNDLMRGKLKNAIFIGESDIDSFPNLHKWNWTSPELEKLHNVETGYVNIIEVENEILSRSLKEFDLLVKKIEHDFSIELNDLHRYIKILFSFVIPFPESRLKNQIISHRIVFERECEEILQEQFYRVNEDYSAHYSQLIEYYNKILHAIVDNRGKLDELVKFKKFSLVVPKDLIQIWQEEIDIFDLKKVKIISYKDFKQMSEENPKKVFFLAFYGNEFLKTILSSQHNISLLLYKEEKERFKAYLQRLKRYLEKEFSSSDRKKLCEIDYPKESPVEDISDMIERHYHYNVEDSIDHYDSCQTVSIDYKLTFEDGELKILNSHRSVILLKGGQRRKERISNLIEGDKVIIYENTTREQLYDIAIKEDKEGRFQQIEEDSKTWKSLLREFFQHICIGDFEKLYELLKENGLSLKSEVTLKRWLSEEDREKFPASIRNLIAVKKTINNLELDEKFDSIKRSRKSHRSIMIALGKDMSSEIMEYIITEPKVKGKILEQFSDPQISKFIDANAPIRQIKKIEIVEDYDGSE